MDYDRRLTVPLLGALTRRLAATAALLLCVFAATIAPGAACAQVVIVGDETRPFAVALIDKLRELLPGVQIRTVPGADGLRGYRGPHAKVLVTLGSEALRDALLVGRTAAPATLMALLVSQDQFASLLKQHRPPGSQGAVTAIYGDPDPAIQLRLIQATFKRPVSVGVWTTTETVGSIARLRSSAAALDITLVTEPVASEQHRVSAAEVARATSAHGEVDAWLALPDATLFNASTLKTILLVTYSRSQPVFGFTASMVTAGAAATVWVPPAVLAVELAESYRLVTAGAEAPGPKYSQYFDVVVNDSVLRSLNLPVGQSLTQMRRLP